MTCKKGKINVLSFGAGVQSTTVLFLSVRGKLPKIDHVIFADTGWEPRGVYKHLLKCSRLCEQHRIPFHIVRYGDLRKATDEAIVRQRLGQRGGMKATLMLPFYTRERGTLSGREGMLRRFCTSNYKVAPLDKRVNKVRREFARKKGLALRRANYPFVNVWLGISTDEMERMKHSVQRGVSYTHPLIDELGWSRDDCKSWLLRKFGLNAPRSACLGCPYQTNAEWMVVKTNYTKQWGKLVQMDESLRDCQYGGFGGERQLYLHPKGPLKDVDLGGASSGMQHMRNECHGMCGY